MTTDAADLGTIRIAPAVIETIVALTALSIPGVVRLASSPSHRVRRILPRHVPAGVRISVRDGAVAVELHLIVDSVQNMRDVAGRVQTAVAEAIGNMVGLPVAHVDVRVQDVE